MLECYSKDADPPDGPESPGLPLKEVAHCELVRQKKGQSTGYI